MNTDFDVVSLGDWLSVCRKAGIQHVDADLVAMVPRDDMLNVAWEPNHTPTEEFMVEWGKLVEATKKNGDRRNMIRWDCCAHSDIKFNLSEGKPKWCRDFVDGILCLDDPRLFDIVSEYTRPRVAAWIRPWVSASIIDDYPVEFRVFVEKREVVGVSSYYPQRPLKVSETILWYVETAIRLTNGLIRATPDYVKDFTADWIVKSDGRILFIEGGPPHTMTHGAHPCCFLPGHTYGIALQAVPGSPADGWKKAADCVGLLISDLTPEESELLPSSEGCMKMPS